MNKKAFSLVEMIIVIAIIILLSVIATSINSNLKTKTLNTRTIADIETLNNALTSYGQENADLPEPKWNTNWFKQDTSYAEKTDSDVFGVYGQITADTLPSRYLNIVPLDQFTWAFYAYGKTLNASKPQFEVAGILRDSWNPRATVAWNYAAQTGPYNLIREYNGPNFVYDESTKYFPYNPNELALNARITEFIGTVTIDSVQVNPNQVISEGDEIQVSPGSQATLYFWDGSKSVIWDTSSQTILTLNEMSYPQDKNSLISKVSLTLSAGTIWTNATQMGDDSEFSVQTWDTTAAVRGTIFGLNAAEQVSVISGTVNKTTAGVSEDITTQNSAVESISSEIIQWTWELTETLKTEVISYDAETNIVTLETNDVFKYDAEYLKASGLQILNPRKWNAGSTGGNGQDKWDEWNFDITDAQGTEIALAFCKTVNDTEVCTRSTSIAKDLSYIITDTFAQQNCPAWEYNGYTYNNDIRGGSNGFGTKLPDPAVDWVDLLQANIACSDGSLSIVSETKICSANYGLNANGECERWVIACPTTYQKVIAGGSYNFSNINLSTQSTGPQVVRSDNDEDTGTGIFGYSLTFNCNASWELTTSNEVAQRVSCNANYTPEWANECREFLACNLINGWKLWTQTTVPHAPTTQLSLVKKITATNTLVQYEGSATCNDSRITLPTDNDSYKFTQYTNVSKGELTLWTETNLNNSFTISITLDSVPTISNLWTKQYLLYKANWSQDLKLFFANDSSTWNINSLCLQKESITIDNDNCINATKDIVLERKIWDKIYLNGQDTGEVLSWDYGEKIWIWQIPNWSLSLTPNIDSIKLEK